MIDNKKIFMIVLGLVAIGAAGYYIYTNHCGACKENEVTEVKIEEEKKDGKEVKVEEKVVEKIDKKDNNNKKECKVACKKVTTSKKK